MSLELTYNLRHLLARKVTTAMTIAGIALVVAVYVATLMLGAGLKKTLSQTGSFENAIILRSGAQNEIQSGIRREEANIILSDPAVLRHADGSPIGTTDSVVLISLKKRSDDQPSNVNVRGVNNQAVLVRPGIKIIAGRRPAAGTREIMVGSAINLKFKNTDVGESIRLVGTGWPVVGIFDAGRTGFSSEIWGDVDVLMPAFKREQFSSLTLKLKDQNSFAELSDRISHDKRFTVIAKRENIFYEEQSKSLSQFISIIGSFISVIFSLGAIVGAMITMYSAVSTRTREIGILRALGFSRWLILSAFLKECILISVLGGCLGVLLASLMTFVGLSTANFDTFSELSFGFAITPMIVVHGLIFSLIMGALGGILPAMRGARINILQALRGE